MKPLTRSAQQLPQVEKIVSEMVDGKQVQKQLYADGS